MARRKKTLRILVTGAGGFLGTHLCQTLSAQGFKIRSLGRRQHRHLEPLSVEQVQGSVLAQEDCVNALKGVDQVYHLAGMVSRSKSDSAAMYDVHVAGTRNILEACVEKKVKDVVVLSTSGTVGVGKEASFMATESSKSPVDLIGDWPYYQSKLFAEREVARFVTDGLPVKIARPTLLLGPGDYYGSSTGDVTKFLAGEVSSALPGGLSFVDARDVAACLPNLMSSGKPGVGYLMGAANMGVRDFLIALSQVSGVAPPEFTIPMGMIRRTGSLLSRLAQLPMLGGLDRQTFEMGCHYWYIDSARARNELGFAPRDWQETLADTVADIRQIGHAKPSI